MLEINQIVPLSITNYLSDGSGMGRVDGQAVFVPYSAVGETLKIRISELRNGFARGQIESVEKSSPARIKPDCPVFTLCGGCAFRHITYEEELKAKQQIVVDAFSHIGEMAGIPVLPVIPSLKQDGYRNNVQFLIRKNAEGISDFGFNEENSHEMVAADKCLLQSEDFSRIAESFCKLLDRYHISAFAENNQIGSVSGLIIRKSHLNGKFLCCPIIDGKFISHTDAIMTELVGNFPEIESVFLGMNEQKKGYRAALRFEHFSGSEYLQDQICGVPVQLDPVSFLQVNPFAAETLYSEVKKMGNFQKNENVLDLYCGAGTIGLSLADCEIKLTGIEINRKSIESARKAARLMGVSDARFLQGDAGSVSQQMINESFNPDVVIMDPPRRGCDEKTLDAVIRMHPKRIVMVSCNPATAARDVAVLKKGGFEAISIQPVDMFPRTKHVEMAVLMSC